MNMEQSKNIQSSSLEYNNFCSVRSCEFYTSNIIKTITLKPEGKKLTFL